MLKNYTIFLLALIFLSFLAIFIIKANVHMIYTPFHDFDEAHRAEKAKRMKEYFSFLVPITGSPVDRITTHKIPLKENPKVFLYYHPERPPFVYWLMIGSTSIFSPTEWAYRFPSFLMGMLTIIIFIIFAKAFLGNSLIPAFGVGTLALIASEDLWLSSQYAQLDTSITFFSTLCIFSLIYYCKTRKGWVLTLSGLSLAGAVLAKGQPAIILLPPVVFLFLIGKLSSQDLFKFFASASIILIPWLVLLEIFFGLKEVYEAFSKFAATSALVEYSHIKAPIFWYARWWWDSLRPGWSLFLAFIFIDLKSGEMSWQKKALLSFIIPGFLLFSLSTNKIWWYVLPLVPAVAFYTLLSVRDYLKRYKTALFNLSAVIGLLSVPIGMTISNKLTLIYGGLATLISFIILNFRLKRIISSNIQTGVFLIVLAISLASFLSHFPSIVPYHQNTKFVAKYFFDQPGEKCLWFYDMPPETALFYSNAGEVFPLAPGKSLFPDCQNYLITPAADKTAIDSFSKNSTLLYQRGTMKLYKL